MSNLENHNPQVIRQVSKEVKKLSTEQLEGIKIQINESNLTDIQAVIEGPGKLIQWKLLVRVNFYIRSIPYAFSSFPFSLMKLEHLTLVDSFAFS